MWDDTCAQQGKRTCVVLVAKEYAHVLVFVLGNERPNTVGHDVRVRGGVGYRRHAFDDGVNINRHAHARAVKDRRHTVLEIPLAGATGVA